MQPESGLRTWQWVVTVLVVLALIVTGIMVFSNKGSDENQEGPNLPSNSATTTSGTSSILLGDQYPGNVVYVSSVDMKTPGWVVIHKDNKGDMGDIIGSAYVPAGVSPVKVTLTSPVIDGGTYYAVLHNDDGDKKFDATKDLPMKDAKGNTIQRIFRGSISAEQNTKG